MQKEAEQQAANISLRDSRRAALSLMEDAVAARREAEVSNAELRREVAERKHAEESLRESEQRLKRAQEISHLGSWELDLVSNSLTWSDEVYRIFGLKPQEFGAAYEAFLEAVHPDDRAAVDAAYSGSLQEGRDAYEIEHRVVRKATGEVRIVHEKCEHIRDAAGRIVRSVGMVHDITDSKKAEELLREANRRLTVLSETAGALLAAERPQVIVEELCRKAMEHLDCQTFFNFLVDEEAGRLHLNACAGIPGEAARDIEWLDYGVAVCGCAARDGKRIVAEHIPTTPDERTELVKSYGIKAYACHPLRGTGGKVLGTLSFGTRSRETFREEDLSLMKAVADQVAVAMERESAREKLEHLVQELEEANKELESFIYSVSHDLHGPLRSMGVFAKIVASNYADQLGERGKEYLIRIERASSRMNRIIEDLLHLSRVSRYEIMRMKVDLSNLAQNVMAGLHESSPGRDMEVKIQKDLIAQADPRLMELALSNLLGNAWKFTSKKAQGRIEFGAFEQEGKIVYAVRDNGAGFDAEHAGKMFLPFQRLHGDDEFEGTGIGLAIVELAIRRHGGKVWAEGEVGEGAAVFFTLA